MTRNKFIRGAQAVVVIAAVAVLMAGYAKLTYAATGSLTLTPSTGSGTVGSTLTVTLHENSGSDAAIGVDTVINYPSNLLQFVSASTIAPFSVAPPDSTSAGSVQLVRGAYSGVTGDQVVSVLTFNVVAAGSATLSFGTSSISPATGSGNLLTANPSSTYTLSEPAGSGTGSGSGGGSTGGGTTPPPATPSTGSGTPKGTSVNVTPAGGSAVTVPNNGAVAVTANDTTVQPTTVQTEGVKKVEYYLGTKLVDTETKAPYSYNVATGKLKNGTYDLITKTYYENGSVKQSTQHLVIKNAAKKSAVAPISITVIALLALVGVFMILQRRRTPVSAYAGQTPSQTIVTSDKPVAPVVPQVDPKLQTAVPKPNANMPAPGTVISVKDDSEPKQ